MEQTILKLLSRRDYTPLNAAELLATLGWSRHRQRELEHELQRLERKGQVARIKQGNRYALPLEADLIPGRIRVNRQGVGFLQPDGPALPEVRIPQDATSTAMHGDHVLVRRDVSPRFRPHQRTGEVTGRVVRVLERSRTQLVGTLQRSPKFLFVIPDDPRIPQDIYVPPPRDLGRAPQIGDKVVVELVQWQSRHTNPEGEIIEVLGPPDAEGVDMLAVIRNYDLALHFPKKVLVEARAFGEHVTAAELADRVDCRTHSVVTIDPEDAKDFDDAICLERAEHNQWKLWVHIADVSHYVKTGTALDAEAARRGNSTYLVDRVIPMLPEALSNELCSLKPQVDRLTKCVEFLLSDEGRVLKTRFYPAVIHSQQRYHYKEALAVLQRPPRTPLEKMLHEANRLAQKIRRTRFQAGSLDLDFPETKILLDERGRVAGFERVENDISHQLIEEFMLLANEAVAARLTSLRRPAVYRIHEPPDDKRLEEYRQEILAHHIPCGQLTNRREVQKLLQKLGTLPIGPALKIGFLRSLMRARYAVEPLGHYGLAKKNYTHFTSPIRRYADLLVHRALFEPSGRAVSAQPLEEVVDHISGTERNSDDAERDSRDVKLFAFLQAQLKSSNPTRYHALVTDVRNFGFFVDVQPIGLSGLVPVSGLDDDFYVFESNRGQLIGRRTRRVFKLGDRVEVQVAKVDTFKRQVDFRLAGVGKKPALKQLKR
jgi:ribonuclease R